MAGYWSATVPQWFLSLCLYYRPSGFVLIYTCISGSYYHSIRRPLGIITSAVPGRTVRAAICIQVNISIYGAARADYRRNASALNWIRRSNGLDSHYQFTFTCYCDSRMITISPTVLNWIFPILTRNFVCTTSHKEHSILHKQFWDNAPT